MNLDFLKGKYSAQIWLLIIIVLFSNLLFGLLAINIVSWNEKHTYKDVSNLNNISLVSNYIFIVLNQIGTFLLPALVFAGLWNKTRGKYLKINLSVQLKFWIALILILPTTLVLMGFMGEINHLITFPQWVIDLEKEAEQTTRYILKNRGYSYLIINLFVLGVLPAIAEEFMFRGVLQKLLIKTFKGKVFLGIIVTAFIFSFIHFQFLTFLPRFFMGITLGYLFVWSKSILLPITLHFLNNAIGILSFYFTSDPEKTEYIPWEYAGFCSILFIALFYWLKPKKHTNL